MIHLPTLAETMSVHLIYTWKRMSGRKCFDSSFSGLKHHTECKTSASGFENWEGYHDYLEEAFKTFGDKVPRNLGNLGCWSQGFSWFLGAKAVTAILQYAISIKGELGIDFCPDTVYGEGICQVMLLYMRMKIILSCQFSFIKLREVSHVVNLDKAFSSLVNLNHSHLWQYRLLPIKCS